MNARMEMSWVGAIIRLQEGVFSQVTSEEEETTGNSLCAITRGRIVAGSEWLCQRLDFQLG
jgi:hypothetical protein